MTRQPRTSHAPSTSQAGCIATIILETSLIVQAYLSNIYYQTAVLSASNNGDNNIEKLKTVEAILHE